YSFKQVVNINIQRLVELPGGHARFLKLLSIGTGSLCRKWVDFLLLVSEAAVLHRSFDIVAYRTQPLKIQQIAKQFPDSFVCLDVIGNGAGIPMTHPANRIARQNEGAKSQPVRPAVTLVPFVLLSLVWEHETRRHPS